MLLNHVFRTGKQNSGSKVTEFCAQALLALEVLVHPRALPLIDTPLPNGNNYSVGKTGFDDPKNKLPQKDGIVHDVYDFLRDKYIEYNTGSEVPASKVCKGVQFDEKSLEASRDRKYDETNVVNALHDKMMPRGGDEGSKPGKFYNKIESTDGSRLMMDVDLQETPNRTALPPVSCDDDTMILPRNSSVFATKGLENNVSDVIPSDSQSRTFLSGKSTKGIDSTPGVETTATSLADKGTSKMSMIEQMSVIEQDDESADSFPDIVDADPDSDSE